ncbi:anthranilate synthase component I family protein [Nannocystaceae bacterium ST9]
MSRSDLAARVLAHFAQGHARATCWLDGGGLTRSVVGWQPEHEVRGDDLALLDEVEARFRAAPERPWIGWVGYDLGAAALLGRPARPSAVPQLVMRQFASFEVASPESSPIDPGPHAWPLGPLRPAIDAERYREQVRRILEHIAAGDTYQVNLSQRFVADWLAVDAPLGARIAAVHRRLRAATPASMGALIAIDEHAAIVSNSPETLLDVRFGEGLEGHDLARSWPIKGTRPRASDPEADAVLAAELRASSKDQAEHVMIVDLVRNDLGRLALPGSVRAPSVPSLVSLPTVHHLVSEVACTLAPGWTLRELFAALFPGGSITGAPKRRTVEIIDAIEGEPRGIYCGAIVLLESTGIRMSIPIRTGVLDSRGLELRSGGGIVIDSEPESERLETLAKARAFTSPDAPQV